MALLARQDPILDQIIFYEDVPLFEDELHDNGESILNARIVRDTHISVQFTESLHADFCTARHAAFILHPRSTIPTGR